MEEQTFSEGTAEAPQRNTNSAKRRVSYFIDTQSAEKYSRWIASVIRPRFYKLRQLSFSHAVMLVSKIFPNANKIVFI